MLSGNRFVVCFLVGFFVLLFSVGSYFSLPHSVFCFCLFECICVHRSEYHYRGTNEFIDVHEWP